MDGLHDDDLKSYILVQQPKKLLEAELPHASNIQWQNDPLPLIQLLPKLF